MFSLKGLKTKCRFVSIHDGDTITVVIPLFDEYYKFNIRLYGIDTCEMTLEETKDLAVKARNRVFFLATGQEYTFTSKKQLENFLDERVYILDIECFDFDKYGRVLGKVSINDIDISQVLIKEKLAYEYNGGKKKTLL